MIISDLNYLEVAAETSSVVIGGFNPYKPKVDVDVKTKPKLNLDVKVNGTNVSVLNQLAIPTSVAIALDGKAVAKVEAENSGDL